MLGGHHRDPLELEQRTDLHGRRGRGKGAPHDVHVAVHKASVGSGQWDASAQQPHVRMALAELACHLREMPSLRKVAYRPGHAEAHRESAVRQGRSPGRPGRVQDRGRLSGESGPRRRRAPHPARIPEQEGRPYLLLQALHSPGQRGLAHMQPRGSPPVVALVKQDEEARYTTQVKIHPDPPDVALATPQILSEPSSWQPDAAVKPSSGHRIVAATGLRWQATFRHAMAPLERPDGSETPEQHIRLSPGLDGALSADDTFERHPMNQPATSPVAVVVERAEAVKRALGHEIRGPLSWGRGFVPLEDPSGSLPTSHTAWDEAAAALPSLRQNLDLRRALDDLPLLPAGPDALPDAALARAATVLGFLGHSYAHATRTPSDLPTAVGVPWREVLHRLGRTGEPVLSYLDLIVTNWQHLPGHEALRVPELRLLVSAVDIPSEHVFYLTQLEILAVCTPLLRAVARAQVGILTDDADAVTGALQTVRDLLAGPALAALKQIDPRPSSRSYVDPIAWAKVVAPFAVPPSPGVLGPSGTASPVFALLDTLLGRDRHDSRLGQEILAHRAAHPLHWRQL